MVCSIGINGPSVRQATFGLHIIKFANQVNSRASIKTSVAGHLSGLKRVA